MISRRRAMLYSAATLPQPHDEVPRGSGRGLSPRVELCRRPAVPQVVYARLHTAMGTLPYVCTGDGLPRQRNYVGAKCFTENG